MIAQWWLLQFSTHFGRESVLYPREAYHFYGEAILYLARAQIGLIELRSSAVSNLMRNSDATPTVSVVIPTAWRPRLLLRAIKSCLSGDYSNRTEIIVVANGPDGSWRGIQRQFMYDSRVCFHHLAAPDQNAARTFGISVASGELIRFLDDDDFLFPDSAAEQYRFMLNSSLDFSSAGLSLQDEHGRWLGDLMPPNVESGLIAALSRRRLQIPLAHVYRRSTIGDLIWQPGLRQSEDIVWLIDYVSAKGRTWARLNKSVGVWYQHGASRLSSGRPSSSIQEPTAKALLRARSRLQSQGRLTDDVASVLALSLWECVHAAFHFRPVYWSRIAAEAKRMHIGGRPSARLYSYRLLSSIDPLLLHWIFTPFRLAKYGIKSLASIFVGQGYRTRL